MPSRRSKSPTRAVVSAAAVAAPVATPTTAPAPTAALPADPAAPVPMPLAALREVVDFAWARIEQLIPWAGNPKEHDIPALMRSIRRFGLVSPAVVWRSKGALRVGHGRILALAEILKTEPEFVPKGAQAPGYFPVRLFEFADEDEADAYALADNRLQQLGGWNQQKLVAAMEGVRQRDAQLVVAAGWTSAEANRLLASRRAEMAAAENAAGGESRDDDDDDEGASDDGGEDASERSATKGGSGVSGKHTKAMEAKWGVQLGQLWQIPSRSAPGQVHRIYCGDCTIDKTIAALFPDGEKPRLIICDPPYCSGGYQEAQKSAGSFGLIANDNLSTKGYQKLIRSMFAIAASIDAAYVFTDWRMWSPLQEVVEERSLALRSMVVWDKGTPGMGQLWRTQHELLMYGCKTRTKRRKGVPATGNVIRCKRSGNKLHMTEKPVDLIRQILAADSVCERMLCPVYDPFGGSGPVLTACELEGRVARLCDLIPGHVGSMLERAAELGLSPVLVSGPGAESPKKKPSASGRRVAKGGKRPA